MSAISVRGNTKKGAFNSPALWVVIAAEGLDFSAIFLPEENSVNYSLQGHYSMRALVLRSCSIGEKSSIKQDRKCMYNVTGDRIAQSV